MTSNVFTSARVAFYLRTPIDGGAVYNMVQLKTPNGARLSTAMPPQVGDRFDALLGDGSSCVVVARRWIYPSFGSMSWPYVGGIQDGPLLDVVVERAGDELFADEIADEQDGGTQ